MAKIKYGISNLHYAVLTDEETWTYGEVTHIPGTVKLAISPEGDDAKFYADNIAYFVTAVNNGFSGDLENALLPEEFYIDALGYEKDETTGMLMEVANAISKPIALMFQFETDEKARKVCLYKVNVGRPGMDHETKSETIDPQTDTVPITVSAMKKGDKDYTKGTSSPESTNYDTFFDSVPVPGIAVGE